MGVFKDEGVNGLTYRLAGGVATELPFVSAFNIAPTIKTLDYQGDHTSEKVYRTDGITGTMDLTKFTTEFMTMQGVTEHTAGLPAGYASLYYPEQGTLPYVELVLSEFVTDDDTGDDTLHYLTVYKTKLQPFVPAPMANLAVAVNHFAWSGTPTLTDVDGADLPDSPTQKAVYSLAIAA